MAKDKGVGRLRVHERPVSAHVPPGWKIEPRPDDEFCVWNDPSWRPLGELAETKTDIIRMNGVRWKADNPIAELTRTDTWREGPSQFTRQTITAPGGYQLTSLCRRDVDTQTTWTLKHLLKDEDDVRAYLSLPEGDVGELDIAGTLEREEALGDAGIISMEMGDPLCQAASLFSMEDYTIIAMTEPYLPPRLYEEYMVPYTGEMIRAIESNGGYSRIHSHGRLRGILPIIKAMGPSALDPVEPPPEGDMDLFDGPPMPSCVSHSCTKRNGPGVAGWLPGCWWLSHRRAS